MAVTAVPIGEYLALNHLNNRTSHTTPVFEMHVTPGTVDSLVAKGLATRTSPDHVALTSTGTTTLAGGITTTGKR